ncbi:hypothetical protein [Aeromicrobium chenweiae]|uniref:hypothetical protein n=1 Tax=Aeromicrobium chenweiae TaxID=2079793 RepID=UPI0010926F72|nr:hypothetical protein [Aeromicrobium chenweiae]TGN32087.1 hypothetical protein E4L97_10225 [Aeromicrobium chenweiae]
MAGVLIHDGRRSGQRKWSAEAVEAGRADGVIISPFATPRVSEPRHPSAGDVASAVRSVGGEVVFDPMTHARFLPACNKVDFYDEWELWDGAPAPLDTAASRVSHVERVFQRQDSLNAAHLAPTLQLASPVAAEATHALATARVARGIDGDSWQSLVGTRAFWSSGTRLDAYVGSLVALRSPVWVLTVANEIVVDHVPDLTDVEAFSGLCRTVHSLSIRSRVIVAHADFSGLPAIAAGADTLGSGWDRGQRTFDPLSFHVDSDPGIRIPASYVTQGGLQSILRRDTAQAIERWNSARALALRGGPMPPSDAAQRMHHLGRLREAVLAVGASALRADRVAELRRRYAVSGSAYDDLVAALRPTVRLSDKEAWNIRPSQVLERYAAGEGF